MSHMSKQGRSLTIGMTSPCVNHVLCSGIVNDDSVVPYTCSTCDMASLGHLKFIIKKTCASCGIKHQTLAAWPAQCGHYLCLTCFRARVWYDETEGHVNPETFGCPPCGCANPLRGKQCECDARVRLMLEWKRSHPSEHEAYELALDASMDFVTAPRVPTCPQCAAPILRRWLLPHETQSPYSQRTHGIRT